jgi:agmatine deiminase
MKSSKNDAMTMTAAPLPADLRFRMPAEWEPHEATWLAWPHQVDDWPGKFAPIPWVYGEIVRHLHQSERVRILVHDSAAADRVRRLLRRCGIDLDRIDFYAVPTNRAWTRDSGAIFLRDATGHLGATDWRFNAWAKYDNWQLDDAVAGQMAALLRLRCWQPECRGLRVVLEGGAIDVNGAGLLLTTEECLLSSVQARNPDLSRQDLEQVFAEYMGIRKVLWLNRGIAGDDTHGHVDDLARFVNSHTIVTVVEDDPGDENYRPLQENLDRLGGMTDLNGRRLEVVPLPMPGRVMFAGRRLPASYANFYIANDRVLVPTFNDERDRQALGILADLFPGRQVMGIHAVDLVWGLGTLHCLTQQEPVGNSDGGSGTCSAPMAQ